MTQSDVLKALNQGKYSDVFLSFKEVAEITNLNLAASHRICKSLAKQGNLLERKESRKIGKCMRKVSVYKLVKKGDRKKR